MSKGPSKRFYKRIELEIPVEFELVDNADLTRRSGVISDVTYTGARLVSKNRLDVGQKIQVFVSTLSTRKWIDNLAVVVWDEPLAEGYNTYGLQFIRDNESFSKTLNYLMRQLPTAKTKNGIAWSLLLWALGLPLILTLGYRYSPANYKTLFCVYILSICIERIWETFYTTKERDVMRSSEDWSISAVAFYYVLMIFGTAIEYYAVPRSFRPLTSTIGASLLVSSFMLRWWGMRTLGSQWAVHAVGNTKLQERKPSLIQEGPYRRIRHPIYLAAILELVGIPLIANCYYTLIFVALVNLPLMHLRSRLEEQTLFTRFYDDYVDYHTKTGRFLPRQRAGTVSLDRRKKAFTIDFSDRRTGKRGHDAV